MLIGYKKVDNDIIIVLEIIGNNDENRKVYNKYYAKYRCSVAVVLDIYDMFTKEKRTLAYENDFVYTLNKIIYPNQIYHGIYYFTSEEAAYFFNIDLTDYTGEYKKWSDDGKLIEKCNYVNGLLDGIYESYAGNKYFKCVYVSGLANGLCEEYYNNGKKMIRYYNVNGFKHGLYERWSNDILIVICTYDMGFVRGLYEEYNLYGKKMVSKYYKY
jgi:antitoxin component YwqK of YwqJK toxin-antitoxin module